MRIFYKILLALWAIFMGLHTVQARTLSLAIMPFYEKSYNMEYRKHHDHMREIIINDLVQSGYFKNIPVNAFFQQTVDALETPNFADWEKIKAEVLITFEVQVNAGRYDYIMDMWYVPRQHLLVSKKYTTTGFALKRRLSHMIADDIYTRTVGGKPYFDSQILYVAQTTDTNGTPIQKLAIMDQDGGNLKYLSDGKNMVISPRFSPDGRYIIYVSYKNTTAGVYVHDLKTRKQTFIATDRTTSYTPRFSPDNTKVIFSNIVDGKADIWVMYLKRQNGKIKFDRLTNTKYMDMAPYYAPSGDKIVFMSDRSGRPQLYIMNADGSGVTHISKGSGSYTTPIWSPNGNYIAFTKQKSGQFHIGIMKPDGTGERLLTTSYLDEGPTFSPNGKILLFGRQQKDGDTYLMSVGIDGKNLNRIKTETRATEPDWGALRP